MAWLLRISHSHSGASTLFAVGSTEQDVVPSIDADPRGERIKNVRILRHGGA
jgi:hypothetical protein